MSWPRVIAKLIDTCHMLDAYAEEVDSVFSQQEEVIAPAPITIVGMQRKTLAPGWMKRS
jgi:hypothetical protein